MDAFLQEALGRFPNLFKKLSGKTVFWMPAEAYAAALGLESVLELARTHGVIKTEEGRTELLNALLGHGFQLGTGSDIQIAYVKPDAVPGGQS